MTKTARKSDVLELEHFLPYRLSHITAIVSAQLAERYAEPFDLSVPEWKVMAVLGRFPDLSANEVGEKTVMDKVTVSRAVTRLSEKSCVRRRLAKDDKRRSVLSLTSKGKAIHREIVPMVLHYERELMESLTVRERDTLSLLIEKLEKRTEMLAANYLLLPS